VSPPPPLLLLHCCCCAHRLCGRKGGGTRARDIGELLQLRQYLGHVLSNLQLYLQLDVIETNYELLLEKVAAAQVGGVGLEQQKPLGVCVCGEQCRHVLLTRCGSRQLPEQAWCCAGCAAVMRARLVSLRVCAPCKGRFLGLPWGVLAWAECGLLL
jgi:hypothetical protein